MGRICLLYRRRRIGRSGDKYDYAERGVWRMEVWIKLFSFVLRTPRFALYLAMLNNIKLPPQLIASLYPYSLIDDKGVNKQALPGPEVLDEKNEPALLQWLGDNKKQITIIVREANAKYVTDEGLQLLTNMLTACKLSLADVAIVNLHNQDFAYQQIVDQLKPRIGLLFEVEPSGFGLPMKFPYFQIQPYAGCSYVYAPSLSELEKDKTQRMNLWVTLKRLFGV